MYTYFYCNDEENVGIVCDGKALKLYNFKIL